MCEIKPGYDRVTEVIGVFSGLDKIDKDVLATAAARGTATHKIIDCLVGHIPLFPDEYDELFSYCRNPEHKEKEEQKVQIMIDSYKIWAEGKKWLPKPDRFYCDIFKITGECDQIYKDANGQIALVDFKTPAKESKTWFLQASAYKWLASANGLKIDRLEFVKLSKVGYKPQVFIYEENFELFISVLETFRYFYKDQSFPEDLDFI